MAATDNLAKVLANFPRGEGPLYQQLVQTITLAVERSDLLPGTRLPPERMLAHALKLSRTTVVQAYARLREAGTIESRHGSGTWVRRAGKTGWPSPQEHEVSTAFRRNVVFRSLIERAGDAISFVSAQLPPLPEVDAALKAVARKGAASLGMGQGYFPMGLPALRKAIAAHLSRRGLPTREEQVLITNGAQQAVSLVAGLLVARGETVVSEDPTYIGAIDVFISAGARVLAVPGAAETIDLDRLRALLAMRPRLLYVVPTYHNPTGGLMPERTRREIARLADGAAGSGHRGQHPRRPGACRRSTTAHRDLCQKRAHLDHRIAEQALLGRPAPGLHPRTRSLDRAPGPIQGPVRPGRAVDLAGHGGFARR